MSTQYRIGHLGAQGDGIANTERGPVFIPFTLPGETVTAAVNKDRGDLIAIQEAADNRVEPPCRHFGTCGGCQLQHMATPDYLAWKRNKVVQALKSQRLEPDVGDIVPCAPHSRRRVTFAVRKVEAGMLLGYNRHLSHEIIDITECPISVPSIVEALESLRAVARLSCSTNKPFRMTVTATVSGLDVALFESGKLDDAARKTIADFALASRFARVSVDGEIIVEPTKPQVSMGASVVTFPPGGFLQAVASAEDAMVSLVLDHVGKSKRVADLFAGSGAFSLRLATRSEVHAVEGEAAPLAALDRAFRFTPGLKRVTTEKRDLFERPLTTKELDKFDAVVFDPPRAGAEFLCKQLAKSQVPKVAAVSCNPLTLARDLAILTAGGYRVTSVTPVDQFLWSSHVEAVALLEKPKKRR
ncbi:class I SAM-dependent RNA methyltransferase [Tianweitania sp. BSSL-BM11]|uniref:Class I SAM-dependent RNA methyltransferase n=1 Tax=Tianweitania aestuarii TaxID=2814886 RepID=A0ABS5RRX6_9HYPH|nr:class I SAM-dependent RNA methyltransferase [Tianweitania aestuarii]MBS9719771.1 class I SAM-dependent RNA methyltransferase [Tianweitania aestuarii]